MKTCPGIEFSFALMSNLSHVSECAFCVFSSYSSSFLQVFLANAEAFLTMQNPQKQKTTVTSCGTLQALLVVSLGKLFTHTFSGFYNV